MKKILLSLAAVAMTITANAAPTVVKVNPDQASTVPAETVINNNDFFTATTTFNAKGGKAGSAYVFGDVDLGGSGWIQLRSESAPDATSPFGAQRTDCTSVKFEVKKPVTIYCYIRTGNNKQTAVKMFNSSFELLPYANGATEGKNCGADGDKNNMWEFSWTLNAGTYCMTELAGTGNVAGIGYEEAAGEDPEPAQGETFNVVGMKPKGEFGTVTTPCTIDMDAKTVTFDNFLGSKTTIVCDLVFSTENYADGVLYNTIYNIVPKSGVTEAGDIYGEKTYSVAGLNDIIFTKDGVNTLKLENIKMMFTQSYSVDCRVFNNANKTFELTLFISGDYYEWNATDNTWSTKNPNAYGSMGYMNLELNGSFGAGDESGIEDIVTDNVDENAPVEYYNLQGIRLSEPAAGQIVIRRQGSKVSKILVR